MLHALHLNREAALSHYMALALASMCCSLLMDANVKLHLKIYESTSAVLCPFCAGPAIRKRFAFTDHNSYLDITHRYSINTYHPPVHWLVHRSAAP